MADSLVLASMIELLGQTPSTIPECAGAVFSLAPGYDLSEHVPDQSTIYSLVLDGERPVGDRSSNRTPNIPVVIKAPSRAALAAAREVLMRAVNQPRFTIVWTRDQALPIVLDCFRASSAVQDYSILRDRVFISTMTVTCQALPFGRSDTPVVANFQSPLAGDTAPPSAVTVDAYSTVTGTHWTRSMIGPGPHSAYWTPGNSGVGQVASYTRSGIGPFNLTGLIALTVWAGFGSSNYFQQWGLRLAGRVTFTFTLTDGTHSVSFHTTKQVKVSNNSAAPVWQKIRVPIPASTVNLGAVTGYTITATARPAGDLPYTDLYLDSFTAVPQTFPVGQPTAGVVYDLAGIVGSARAPVSLQLQQPGAAVLTTQKFNTPGVQQWTAPYGVTTVAAQCIGPGGAGSHRTVNSSAGGGGGGGEWSYEPAAAVTPGNTYLINTPAGATPGNTASGPTTFVADAVTVSADYGNSAPANSTSGGAGGSGSTNSQHHNGGAGGTGSGSSNGAGGGGTGGGSAAGSAGSSGGAGGAAGGGPGAPVNSGYAGGKGSPGQSGSGSSPAVGGGGGGDCRGVVVLPNIKAGSGGCGQITLTYLAPPAFATLIVHRPPRSAPDTLTPFVSMPNSDTPDGTTEYPVPSMISGSNAQFNGTYSVTAVSAGWNNPTASRAVTVTVNQYEQAGGLAHSQSIVRTVTPSTDLAGPFCLLGELTLPLYRVPDDNVNAVYTITITSTNTADSFQDVLFLDTMGSTVIIQAPTAYGMMWIDEPPVTSDIGNIMASMFDRGDAVSMLGNAQISGPPLFADPDGNQQLLVYAAEGAPSAQMTYYPRWLTDRLS